LYFHSNIIFIMSRNNAAVKVVCIAVTTLEISHPDSVKLAIAYKKFGLVLYRLKQWDQARLYLEMALQLFERKTSNSTHLAHTYQSLGSVLYHQSEWDKRRDYVLKAVQIYEQKWIMPSSLPDCYYMYANDLLFQEDYTESCHYYRKALKAYRRTALPPLSLAICYPALAAALVRRGKLKEARQSLEQALKIRQVKAPGSFCVAATCAFLATIAHGTGDETQARQYYEQSWDILSRLHNTPRSLDLASCYNHLGDYLHTQGERQQERDCCHMAASITKAVSPSSFHLVTAYFHLGWLSQQIEGDRHAAIQWYTKSLDVYDGLTESRPVYMAASAFAAANSSYGKGCIYELESDYEHSLQPFRMALDTYQRLGPERTQLLLGLNPRPLPTIRDMQQKVAWNPSRLLSEENNMSPFVWCQALAKLQGNVQAIYYILREQPHIVVEAI
jgi:tetratricopeptide (TPR) repeat protein